MSNILLIKRRLIGSPAGTTIPTLTNGELAFNEINNTLYYGGQNSTLAIGGSGAFVTVDTAQTVAGAKTFTNTTTLSSVTFSSDSTINLGNNKITSLAEPTSNSDAATKLYADTIASNSTTAVQALSTEVYNTFVEKTETEAVVLNGGLTVSSGINADTLNLTSNASVSGNLRIEGNLEVLGATTTVETTTTVTSSFKVDNYGSTTALEVTQVNGTNDVAVFKDGADTALVIKGDGNVGIGTATPNEKLTVSGAISASGKIYAEGGLDISAGGGATSLYVENGKVGINTETPNEALTVVGSISASSNLYGSAIDFNTGTIGTVSFDISGNITQVTSISAANGNGTLYGFTLDGGLF